jgi:VWFA-related protein
MKKVIFTGLFAAWAILSLASLEAIGLQAGGQRIPRHDAAAIIKLVAVRVLDAAGRPVTGLRKEDFLLTDNGVRQIVTEFESYVLDEAGMTLVTSDAGAPVRAPLLNRRLFIFLDLQANDEVGSQNAKAAALHFVDTQLRPGDEVAVVGFSPMRGFFIQEYLTTDLGKIRKAIERSRELRPSKGEIVNVGPDDAAGRGSAPGAAERHEIQTGAAGGASGSAKESGGARLSNKGGDVGGFGAVNTSIFMPGTSLHQRTDFVPRMFDLAKTLKYVPGNKSLVLFSGRDVGAAAKSLGQSFASSGTPVYAVNTKNWIMKGAVNLAVKEKHLYLEHSLRDLSEASGGQYFADIKDVQTIAGDVQMLTGNFYVLGYYINEQWDGKFHKLGIRLEKPGYRVLAQAGYFSPKPFAEMSDFEKEIHLFNFLYADTPAAEALDLPAAELGMTLADGWHGVILVEAVVNPKTGVSPAKVELIALIRNENRIPVVSRKWGLNLSAYNGKTLVIFFGSPKGPGKYDGRVVIRDVETGRPAVGRFSFEVPAPQGEGLGLSSPVILVPDEATKLVRLESGPARRRQAAERTLIDLYPFIPKSHRIVVRDLDADTGQVMALLPIRLPAGEADLRPRAMVGARLLPEAGGEEIPLDLQIDETLRSGDGRDFLVLEIELPRPGPGAYTLEISAAASGRTNSVRTTIILK